MIEIPIDKNSDIPLYRQVGLHLEKMILRGTLEEGSKLPGTREMASSLGISRTTVLGAYDYLEAREFIIQKGRSGAYVNSVRKNGSLLVCPKSPSLDMRSGYPSKDLIPSSVLSRISRDLLFEKGEEVLQIAPISGLSELRHTLVAHGASRGIPASWEEVMVTSGGLESISLSMAALREQGVTRMFMEELTYPEAWRIAISTGFEVRSFSPLEKTVEPFLKNLSDRDALYLVPSFQNPTGRTLVQNIRKAILDYSNSRGFWILEDDAYGELRYGETSVPALKALRGSEKVIYTGSFSQPLFPGMRLGYSLVPGTLMESFVQISSRRSGPVSSLVQHLVLEFIKTGAFSQAIEKARFAIQSRMTALGKSLQEFLPGYQFNLPSGGIYLWLETKGLDGDEAERIALSCGVGVSSGNSFCWTGRRIEAVRFSVATLNSAEIRRAVKKLSRAWPSLDG